jgi:hypothetical protein
MHIVPVFPAIRNDFCCPGDLESRAKNVRLVLSEVIQSKSSDGTNIPPKIAGQSALLRHATNPNATYHTLPFSSITSKKANAR